MASEEEDEYYDSIDDAELEQCRSFCNEQFQEDDSEMEEDSPKINEMVPLYNGEVIKSELASLKQDSNSNSEVTLRDTKLKRRNPKLSLLESTRKNRSYLTMFYARNGQPGKRDSVSQRGNRGELSSDEFSEQKNLYENENLESMYETDMEKGNDQLEGSIAHGTYSCVTAASCRNKSQMAVNSSQVFSYSEAFFNSTATSRQRKKRDKGVKKPLTLAELGGLGPNMATEKLESLRRRQDYGKTVSEKNRIKIMENQVVKKLKQEIQEGAKL